MNFWFALVVFLPPGKKVQFNQLGNAFVWYLYYYVPFYTQHWLLQIFLTMYYLSASMWIQRIENKQKYVGNLRVVVFS